MEALKFQFKGQEGKRVVVTGMGALTPVGHNSSDSWASIIKGEIGIAPIQNIELFGTAISVAAQIKNYDPLNFFEKKDAKNMDKFCQYAKIATKEAMEQSQLLKGQYDPSRIGCILGSGVGGLETISIELHKLENDGGRRVSPRFIPMMISNIAAGEIAIDYGICGDNYVVTTACASGTHAIGEAYRKIKYGILDAVITGGTEAPITSIALAGFNNMKALNKTTDPKLASLPFDSRRAGFVIGEGSAILILEEREQALARGAEIFAEIVGYGSSCDAYHITSPDPLGKGAAMSMAEAMAEAGITPEQVDYINAHGTGTPLNDKYETIAIKCALGDAVAKKVAISSTKAVTGHLLGAAGALETIICIKALQEGLMPATVGLEESDQDCDLNYLPQQNQSKTIEYALTNSLGFGGHNGTLCIKKAEKN